MCGDYNSVIGMNKENSIMKFLKDEKAQDTFHQRGKSTLSGIIVEADEKTGLAKNVERFIYGGSINSLVYGRSFALGWNKT